MAPPGPWSASRGTACNISSLVGCGGLIPFPSAKDGRFTFILPFADLGPFLWRWGTEGRFGLGWAAHLQTYRDCSTWLIIKCWGKS